MKKILTMTLLVSMFLSFPISPSVAKTVNHFHGIQRESSYQGYIYSGDFTIYVYGDLTTHIVTGVTVYKTSTGEPVDVDSIQSGGISERNGEVFVNVKVFTSNTRIINVSGKLTK